MRDISAVGSVSGHPYVLGTQKHQRNLDGNETMTYLTNIYICVLILTVVELIFFVVAGMELCLKFVLKTMLITQGCFSYC